ncbi:MAG: helix-turn-helix domain-containing protein [Halobacteria archaeon]|nr:helix-turn-helix domain-containing protein [Halobacteria archaeon]
MVHISKEDDSKRTVELLTELGLMEYEAKVFTALTRIPEADAKKISRIADVPRTRVYNACESLADRGLIQIHESTPKKYRSIPITDAVEVFREEFTSKIDEVQYRMESLEQLEMENGDGAVGVWNLSGRDSINRRTVEMIDSAEDELILILGKEGMELGRTVESISDAIKRGVSVNISTVSEEVRKEIERGVGDVNIHESNDWLRSLSLGSDTTLGRVVVSDTTEVLVTSVEEEGERSGVWGKGNTNGLVILIRTLLSRAIEEE